MFSSLQFSLHQLIIFNLFLSPYVLVSYMPAHTPLGLTSVLSSSSKIRTAWCFDLSLYNTEQPQILRALGFNPRSAYRCNRTIQCFLYNCYDGSLDLLQHLHHKEHLQGNSSNIYISLGLVINPLWETPQHCLSCTVCLLR